MSFSLDVYSPKTLAELPSSRGISRADHAWPHRRSSAEVAAPIVGATKPKHLEDAAAALELTLNGGVIARLERPYTPRLPTYFG